MLVVDTSAALDVLGAEKPDSDLVTRVSGSGEWHAPHLLDIEFLHALRGLVRGGKLTLDRAADIRTDFAQLHIMRYPISGIADRVWELRDTLTAYDATYIALAEVLRCPLVTCDKRLAGASGHGAAVELYPRN